MEKIGGRRSLRFLTSDRRPFRTTGSQAAGQRGANARRTLRRARRRLSVRLPICFNVLVLVDRRKITGRQWRRLSEKLLYIARGPSRKASCKISGRRRFASIACPTRACDCPRRICLGVWTGSRNFRQPRAVAARKGKRPSSRLRAVGPGGSPATRGYKPANQLT